MISTMNGFAGVSGVNGRTALKVICHWEIGFGRDRAAEVQFRRVLALEVSGEQHPF
ncbi:hypothetical protein EV648_107247 [Kribbella sp. VKM Ac-2568]|nr:hypothetical protein EV648_107247 [Kribbella sp. VKM Ac-2568]